MKSEYDKDYTLEDNDRVFESTKTSEYSMEREYNGKFPNMEETFSDTFYAGGRDYSTEENFFEKEEIAFNEKGHPKHKYVSEVEEWYTKNEGTKQD